MCLGIKPTLTANTDLFNLKFLAVRVLFLITRDYIMPKVAHGRLEARVHGEPRWLARATATPSGCIRLDAVTNFNFNATNAIMGNPLRLHNRTTNTQLGKSIAQTKIFIGL